MVPVKFTHLPRVPQTASPVLPSLLVYLPVTFWLLSCGTAVALPLASVNVSGLSEGCSSSLANLMPSTPSLLSLNSTSCVIAVSVVIRSITLSTAVPEKMKVVFSVSIEVPSGFCQLACTCKRPSLLPFFVCKTFLCTMVPNGPGLFPTSFELFQKSKPFTSP